MKKGIDKVKNVCYTMYVKGEQMFAFKKGLKKMKKMAKVFRYNVWPIDANGKIDFEYTQTRFVVAYTEDEAESKLIAYGDELEKNGFCNIYYVGGIVDIDGVII